MSELKPCPFCGGPVELEKTLGNGKWWGVICRNTLNRGGTCAIQQIPSASEEAAVERWNRRTQPEATKPAQDLGASIRVAILEEVMAMVGANATYQELTDWMIAEHKATKALLTGTSP